MVVGVGFSCFSGVIVEEEEEEDEEEHEEEVEGAAQGNFKITKLSCK